MNSYPRLWLFILLLVSVRGFAGLNEKAEELEKTQSRIQQLENNIKLSKEQELALLKQLADIEKKYGKLATALTTMGEQISSQRKVLEVLRKTINILHQQIKEQSLGLTSQIRAAHAMGRQERLKLVLNQQDPSRSNRLIAYYNYLNNARVERLENLNISVVKLSESEQQQIIAAEKLELLIKNSLSEQHALNRTGFERQLLLDRLKTDVEVQNTELVGLRESELALKEILQQRSRKFIRKHFTVEAFAPLKGRLDWPVAGKIQKHFGSKRANSRWDGVLIVAKEGEGIKAVSSGRVIFADWLRGYGLLTIIEHGDDYMTLYAFAQSLEKKVGDQVEVGEMIAAVGKSDGRSQAGLYFGIRRKGKPVNPVDWCKKLSNGRIS
jgi:septal ring factor EnvC (AmiA/AmiB activator)